jgi:hypothetical protein
MIIVCDQAIRKHKIMRVLLALMQHASFAGTRAFLWGRDVWNSCAHP